MWYYSSIDPFVSTNGTETHVIEHLGVLLILTNGNVSVFKHGDYNDVKEFGEFYARQLKQDFVLVRVGRPTVDDLNHALNTSVVPLTKMLEWLDAKSAVSLGAKKMAKKTRL